MELETAELFIDNLLDFSSDIGEDGDDDDESKKRPFGLNKTQHHTNTETNTNNSAELTISDSNAHQDSFPGLVEEELEWLSNEDAFPPIESFDILSLKPNNVPKNPSPVSVLENSNAGLRVPVQARSKRRRRRRSSFSDLSGQQWWYCYEPKKKNSGATRMSMTPSMVRRCLHCQAEKTPQWRAGPLGPKTLCNACGVRYKSGRLVPEYRPASSPSFSDELHSNSHRKILDMRKQKQKEVFYPSPDNGQQWWYCYEPKKKNMGATRTSTITSTVRRCRHCQAKKTPQWREGPLGPRTLCNACGVRYRSGRLEPEYRPASSPSFSDEQHSNSHKKILDMRKQQKQEEVFYPSSDNGR